MNFYIVDRNGNGAQRIEKSDLADILREFPQVDFDSKDATAYLCKNGFYTDALADFEFDGAYHRAWTFDVYRRTQNRYRDLSAYTILVLAGKRANVEKAVSDLVPYEDD